jgi:hypothetical protein
MKPTLTDILVFVIAALVVAVVLWPYLIDP